jgi:hypothetical protein
MLVCRECGNEFAAPIDLQPEERICPHCQAEAAFLELRGGECLEIDDE